jgi:hypothetical protein
MSLNGVEHGRAFAPEDIQVITKAYHVIVDHLSLQSPESKEQAAKIVTEIAGNRVRLDIDELVQSATIRMSSTI